MTAPTNMADALFHVFTTTILFPDRAHEQFYRALCGLGYAEEAAQGHALGYRITPAGYAVAQCYWGHGQR